ncbi:MAG: hypothetical protein PHZ07_02050 [Patescibacteria group bacterium]|nr:hypothetical protein [Patescibacteria group bacterium]MDD4304033.1 hypothetical protein [Patescibacteria group bacterium]MDD4694910.1 hypothetical protein [Patescibacteria group bacterium]
MKYLQKNILLGITGRTNRQIISKIKDIDEEKIKIVSLFLEFIEKSKRNIIYDILKKSSIKEIPLVHIRDDFERDEIKFLKENYNTKYFTIHEDHFNFINNWKGYYKNLYLEMNTDNFVSKKVKINKIGGFCIDLSHFKVEEQKWSKEFLYILKNKNKNIFLCNHINGYSYKKNKDLHTIKNLSEFDYLSTLPKFIFGKIIAIETFNKIENQLKFKKYLLKILNNQAKSGNTVRRNK